MSWFWLADKNAMAEGVTDRNDAISGTASMETFCRAAVPAKNTVRCLMSPGSKDTMIDEGDHVIFGWVEDDDAD